MCFRVNVHVDCAGKVEPQDLAHVLTMLGPGAIGVRGGPTGWTAVLHFHAATEESAKSMALARLVSASAGAKIPAPVALSCEATPEVDTLSDGLRRPFLSWSATTSDSTST